MRWVISSLQIVLVCFAIITIPPFSCMLRPRCRYQPSIFSHLFAKCSIQPVLRRFSLPAPSFLLV